MTLKYFIGLHELSGVDDAMETIEHWGIIKTEVNVIRFILDGETYKAEEDPEDGYRSCLGEIKLSDEKVKNKFPPQKVFGKLDDEKYNDIIHFLDIKTGETILSIGTDNSDGYYPEFVFYYKPENMAINQKKKK